ncbi:MAG: glycosyl hydrolase family 18 protein [Lachnospiraceae bacterium]|nr:glycosyl hydrolase family 18 protein [Lachnospiraceae bacterium]
MNYKNKTFRRLALMIIAIGLLSIVFVCIQKFMPGSDWMSADSYFGLTEGSAEEPTLGVEGETVAVIVVDGEIEQERALIVSGNVYIDYTLVQNTLNSRFYWDSSEALMLFTTAEQIFEIGVNTSAYTIDGESFDAGYEIVKTTSSGMFVAMTFLQQYTNMRFETYESPSRVVVTTGSVTVTVAEVKQDAPVRYRGGIKSDILTEVTAGEQVTVLEQMENWTQILTADGYVGYIKNRFLTNIEETVRDTYYQSDYSSISLDGRVNLVFHQINYTAMNDNLSDDIADMTGVNVISPTWYYLSDNSGSVLSYASADYVAEAHEAGLQVWALVSNFSEDVSTATLLATRSSRQTVQNYLIEEALELGFDGINIDFESIAQESGADYVQFLRELSILCRKNGIILSVDVPVPMDYSTYYNRKELGCVCDYVIMMGYDEHYSGSDAGSVASLEFEETGIQNMLLEVSQEKIISAIPFYSRVWYTETLSDGTTNVTSEVVTMGEAQTLLSDMGVTSSYDETTGQQYAQWTSSDGRLCQIWLEDADSVSARAALVSQYNLGGIAAWRLGYETDDVWAAITGCIA